MNPKNKNIKHYLALTIAIGFMAWHTVTTEKYATMDYTAIGVSALVVLLSAYKIYESKINS